MKKIKITHKHNELGWSEHLSDDLAQSWVDRMIASNAWGKPERWVLHKDEPFAEAYDEADVLEEELRELTPAIEAVLDDQGVEVSPAVPAVMQKLVKLRAEYTVSIEDITAQYELDQAIMKRKAEYPSAEEFMNAFFDGGDEAISALQQKRLLIKQKYPKP